MLTKLLALSTAVISLMTPAIATAATAPVITYDGNSKVTFTTVDFTFVKDGKSINAGVERKACYFNYANKYTVYASASRNNRVVSAQSPAELQLLKEVCKNNPAVKGKVENFFDNRNNLWAK